MKKGDKVLITPSEELSKMGLSKLCGREAIIDEVIDSDSRKNKGCWVVLVGEPFENESEWYIPLCSLA
jgi:hypothetical protein